MKLTRDELIDFLLEGLSCLDNKELARTTELLRHEETTFDVMTEMFTVEI